MCSLASPSIIPRLLSPGAQAACDAVLLGVSPLPVLPSAQERQEHTSQGDRMEAQGPWPERASGTGGLPQAGETRWLVGWHPPLSRKLGSSRGTLQALLSRVPPQGGSQPLGLTSATTIPPAPTQGPTGTLRGTPLPTRCPSWSGVLLMP